jgi:hypothetical protein
MNVAKRQHKLTGQREKRQPRNSATIRPEPTHPLRARSLSWEHYQIDRQCEAIILILICVGFRRNCQTTPRFDSCCSCFALAFSMAAQGQWHGGLDVAGNLPQAGLVGAQSGARCIQPRPNASQRPYGRRGPQWGSARRRCTAKPMGESGCHEGLPTAVSQKRQAHSLNLLVNAGSTIVSGASSILGAWYRAGRRRS